MTPTYHRPIVKLELNCSLNLAGQTSKMIRWGRERRQ